MQKRAVAAFNARRRRQHCLDAFADDKAVRHFFVGPQANDGALHRSKRARFLCRVVDAPPPDAARLAGDYVGEAGQYAWRLCAAPRATWMPAQAAALGDGVDVDAAIGEVSLGFVAQQKRLVPQD